MENMTDILDYISTWSALKWVVIVLIAGFIGQFGKMLAQFIVRKINMARLKKQEGSVIEPPAAAVRNHELPVTDMQKTDDAKPDITKILPDKKALKIMAKERKKASKKSK